MCDCSCHDRKTAAMLKHREARKTGGFYYYHEDCFCCIGFLTDPKDRKRISWEPAEMSSTVEFSQ